MSVSKWFWYKENTACINLDSIDTYEQGHTKKDYVFLRIKGTGERITIVGNDAQRLIDAFTAYTKGG